MIPSAPNHQRFWLRPVVCTVVGMVGNVVLSIGKLAGGILAGSAALVADGVHSISDVISDFGILLALKTSTRPPDQNHPYGHHSFETLGAVVVALIMLITAALIAKSAILNLVHGVHHEPTLAALITALISVALKEVMARYTFLAGKLNNSPALLANGAMHRSDAFSSLAAAAGIGGAMLGWPLLDSIAALVIALLIIKMGWELLYENVMALMDTMPDAELVAEIKNAANGVKGVQEVRGLHARQRGSWYLVDLRIAVDASHSIAVAHDIAHEVEDRVRQEVTTVTQVFVHVEPGTTEQNDH